MRRLLYATVLHLKFRKIIRIIEHHRINSVKFIIQSSNLESFQRPREWGRVGCHVDHEGERDKQVGSVEGEQSPPLLISELSGLQCLCKNRNQRRRNMGSVDDAGNTNSVVAMDESMHSIEEERELEQSFAQNHPSEPSWFINEQGV